MTKPFSGRTYHAGGSCRRHGVYDGYHCPQCAPRAAARTAKPFNTIRPVVAVRGRPPHGGYPGVVAVRRQPDTVPEMFALGPAEAYFLGCKCSWHGGGQIAEFHPHCPVGPQHRGWPFGRGPLVNVLFEGRVQIHNVRLDDRADEYTTMVDILRRRAG